MFSKHETRGGRAGVGGRREGGGGRRKERPKEKKFSKRKLQK
jgi:hypothetical protein